MVDIIDFLLYIIILCSADHNKNIFFRVSNYYWKKMESKIVALYSRLCTHYFNVHTIWPNKIFEIEWLCWCEILWWQIVTRKWLFGILQCTIVTTLKCHMKIISYSFLSIELLSASTQIWLFILIYFWYVSYIHLSYFVW